MRKIGSFDVMKVMCERNLDIRLSALDNLRGARKIKGGSEVKIGVAGDVVTGIALGKFVGGLILADSSQFKEVKSELEKTAAVRADNELLPCPFCGSADLKLENLVDDDDYFVSCNSCEIQQIANYTRSEAVHRWNQRADGAA